MDRQAHWNRIYRDRDPREVSWYQTRPDRSLELIAASGVGRDAGIIDIGGGASTLVDYLLRDGRSGLAVLDLSAAALAHARARLGPDAHKVEWLTGDVTSFLPPRRFGLWHDRAVFHFLTEPADRQAYVSSLRRTLRPGGSVVMATFAVDGPRRCSGLEVMRHDRHSVRAALGEDFRLEQTRRETHLTPSGVEQRFVYFRFLWADG